MTAYVPSGITVTRPDCADLLDLGDEWAPLVTVRIVTRTTVIYVDPLVWTVTCIPLDGRPRSRGVRDSIARVMRDADLLVLGKPWSCEALVDDVWRRIEGSTTVRDITVVHFPSGPIA